MNTLTKVALCSFSLSITAVAVADPFNEKYMDNLANVSSDNALTHYRIERDVSDMRFNERSDIRVAASEPGQRRVNCAPDEALAYTIHFNEKSGQAESGIGYRPNDNYDAVIAQSDYSAPKKTC